VLVVFVPLAAVPHASASERDTVDDDSRAGVARVAGLVNERLLQLDPPELAHERAYCPRCEVRRELVEAAVIGRVGLGLVFRCRKCGARFHVDHHPPTWNPWDDLRSA
jgi:hypothetical protein